VTVLRSLPKLAVAADRRSEVLDLPVRPPRRPARFLDPLFGALAEFASAFVVALSVFGKDVLPQDFDAPACCRRTLLS
jgi:hypothetical protein